MIKLDIPNVTRSISVCVMNYTQYNLADWSGLIDNLLSIILRTGPESWVGSM